MDLGSLLKALGGGGGGDSGPPGGGRETGNPEGDQGFSLDPALLSMVMEMLGAFRQRDQNEELLRALRPYFHDERQKKVDEAIQMVKLLRLLPLLREKGILGDLLGGRGQG